MYQFGNLTDVVWVGRIITVSAYTFEVAFSVHNLAVLICGFVFVQVDWLAAHRADVLLMARAVWLAHGGFPPLRKPYHICAVAYSWVSNGKSSCKGRAGQVSAYGSRPSCRGAKFQTDTLPFNWIWLGLNSRRRSSRRCLHRPHAPRGSAVILAR